MNRLTRARIDGDDYWLDLKDNGAGISLDELPKPFEPFYTTKPNGKDFGSAFCKRAAETHDGSIIIESWEGVGMTFTIRLPLNPIGPSQL